MAEHGRDTITLTSMALALRIARSTLRHYFCDLDALLAEILHRHLRRLADALGEIPYDDPDLHRKRRAAYLNATRTPLGGLNEAHLLLVRDRHLLPDDLLPLVESYRTSIGLLVAGPDPEPVLALLDNPACYPEAIEATLAPRTPHQANPAQPPALQPVRPQPPPLTAAQKDQIRARLPHHAVPSAPGDPPDDLTRFSQPHLTPQPQPRPNGPSPP
jgi:AcrR family transcriptional regulator